MSKPVINPLCNTTIAANARPQPTNSIDSIKKHPDLKVDTSIKNQSLLNSKKQPENSIGKSALESLPQATQQSLLSGDINRVVLIANNPSISTSKLDHIIRPSDLLVLFNNFIHADYFATSGTTKKLPKLVFFRQNGCSPIHFGLPPRRNRIHELQAMSDVSSLGLLTSNIEYQYPSLDDDPKPHDEPADLDSLKVPCHLHQYMQDKAVMSVISENHEVVADYPHFEDIHSSAPSSGFFIYRVMLAIRYYLLSAYDYNLDIVMVGFNHDEKTDYYWHGHNWQFERDELNPPPDGVSVIKQF